jgi:hypothetical protein
MSVKLYTVGRVSFINEVSRKGVVRVLARGCVYEFRPAIELPVYSLSAVTRDGDVTYCPVSFRVNRPLVTPPELVRCYEMLWPVNILLHKVKLAVKGYRRDLNK